MKLKDECNYLALIERTVRQDLSGAQVIALTPAEFHNIDREGYWEHAFIVVWARPVRLGQPSEDDDGYTYCTHRVHVNSLGKGACFDGHYDQSKLSAYEDMLDRSGLKTALTDA